MPCSTARPSTGRWRRPAPRPPIGRSLASCAGSPTLPKPIVRTRTEHGARCACSNGLAAARSARSIAPGIPQLDRDVALKLLPAEPQERLIEEGRRLARVRHPNVVTIYGAERIDDRVGLWMEFIKGRTLEDLVVSTDGGLPPEDAAIGLKLCAPLCGPRRGTGASGYHRSQRDDDQRGPPGADGLRIRTRLGNDARGRFGRHATVSCTRGAVGRPTAVASIGHLQHRRTAALPPHRRVPGERRRFLDSLRRAHVQGERVPMATASDRAAKRLHAAMDRALDPQPDRRFDDTTALAGALDGREANWTAAGWTAALGLVLAVVVAVVWQRWPVPATGPDDAEASTARADAAGVGNDSRAREFRRAWAMAESEGVVGPAGAAKIFAEMIAADAAYAPAHAGLALADAYLSMNPYQGRTFAQVSVEMREAALTAVRLDPTLAEAHVARGWVHARQLEWEAAERSFREAIRRDPLLLGAYTGIAHSALIPLGRHADAEQFLREAMVRDPLAQPLRLTLGRVLLHANRPADAVAVLEPARRTDSDLLQVDLYLGRSLALLKRFDEALPLLERRRQRLVDPNAGLEPWVAWVYVALDWRADAEALAAKYDHLPFRRAIINAALGRADRMFHGMEEMIDGESQRLAHLLRAPELAGFRRDSRFISLVKRLRLDGAQW